MNTVLHRWKARLPLPPLFPDMMQQDLLSRLETELRDLLALVRSQFSNLDEATLRRRPQPEAWNALECFAHLNAFSEAYLPRIERAIHKAKARRWEPAESLRYFSRGQRAIRRAEWQNGKVFKTKKIYNFLQQPLTPETLKTFLINGERLLRLLQAAAQIDLNRATVEKAHAWFGTYSAGNLLEFLVVHTRRHVEQARRAATN